MAIDERDLRLDGNTAAGLLDAVFRVEATLVWTCCAGCGAEAQVGALVAYGHGMGMVLRCPGCDTAVVRIAETRGRLWLDLRGARVLRVEPSATPAYSGSRKSWRWNAFRFPLARARARGVGG